MYFWLILTIFSGGQYKLGGGWEAPKGGGLNPQPPDKSSTAENRYRVFEAADDDI